MAMKFSELAAVYDRISEAGNDAARVKLLADALQNADKKALPAVAHFSFGELVRPEYSDRLGIGPATIRDRIAEIAGKTPAEIDDEVRETGDMSEVAALYSDGKDKLRVEELWRLVSAAIEKEEPRAYVVEHVFKNVDPVVHANEMLELVT